MYTIAVRSAVASRVGKLRQHGIPGKALDEDWQRYKELHDKLCAAFTPYGFPDEYLFNTWKTPIELGFVRESSFAYYDCQRTLYELRIADHKFRSILEEMDVILLKLSLFGDTDEKT